MDLSNIDKYVKEHMPVYAAGAGGLAGASDTHIGNVDKVEGGKYVKLTRSSLLNGEDHWFPVEWIRNVDERALYLNKSVDELIAELLDEQPAAG